MFFCYVEVDLSISEVLVQDLFDIGFSIKDRDTHVFVCFDYDVFIVVDKLTESVFLQACDVGS